MSAHKQTQEFDLQDSVSRAEAFFKKNAKSINLAVVLLVLLIGSYFAFQHFYSAPREQKAQEMIFKAQQWFEQDSFRLALNGDGNNYGYLQVIHKYGSTKAGQLAKYSAGVCYINLGEFAKAIDYLKQFNSKDKIVQAMDYGLIGDAYGELGKWNDAVEYYKKAGYYNENELTAPMYLMRAGLALEKAGKNEEAIIVYKQIKEKYPLTREGQDMDRFLARLGETQ